MQMASRAVAFVLMAGIWTTAWGQATYELTFESEWSSQTHPGAYPSNAHFSPLIGGTHNGSVSYWELGGIASSAIEQMAETGGTAQLRNMVLADIKQGSAAEVVQAAGFDAPGSRTTTFTVSAQHPLLTLVTMVAPSPDWFVGVSGLDFRGDGQWTESIVIDLDNYDAGTDAGADFTSSNMDVTPHEPISILGAPLEGLPRVGTFTFSLVSSTALCDLNSDGTCGIADLDELLSVGPIDEGVAVEYGVNHHLDLNGDDVINLADRDDWLIGAAAEHGSSAPYSPADANLDGLVDEADFMAWFENKFTVSLAASDGDFSGDGIVDALDFIIWNEERFLPSAGLAVPEPSAAVLLVFAGLWCLRRRTLIA